MGYRVGPGSHQLVHFKGVRTYFQEDQPTRESVHTSAVVPWQSVSSSHPLSPIVFHLLFRTRRIPVDSIPTRHPSLTPTRQIFYMPSRGAVPFVRDYLKNMFGPGGTRTNRGCRTRSNNEQTARNRQTEGDRGGSAGKDLC